MIESARDGVVVVGTHDCLVPVQADGSFIVLLHHWRSDRYIVYQKAQISPRVVVPVRVGIIQHTEHVHFFTHLDVYVPFRIDPCIANQSPQLPTHEITGENQKRELTSRRAESGIAVICSGQEYKGEHADRESEHVDIQRS